MSNKKRLIQVISGLVVVVLIIVIIVAVSGGKSKPSTNADPPSGKVSGTITFAEGATANPNWIFPYESCQYCSVDNINQFQDEMFRPMYWFGLGGSVSLVPSLSLAYNPVYSNHDKTVTMKLKGWKFSDGQVVNAQSVMFSCAAQAIISRRWCAATARGSGTWP